MRLTIALPHTTSVFCRVTSASTKHLAMLSDEQLELLNSDTGRELSHIFSSMPTPPDASRRMWQGLKTICSSRNNSSAEVRADPLLAEELNSSYDQWDPCGEGEQLQVPRCKHLRGPELDCTHSNSG